MIARTYRQAGLTLIELMVAVALLALITSMAYRGLDGVSRSSERNLAEGDHWQGIALLFERIASDVAQPARRPVRAGADNAASLPEWWGRGVPGAGDATGVDPTAAQLEFTRKSASGRDEIRLGYRLREDKVELLLWPVLDRAPGSQPEVYVLLEGVGALRFRHLDATGAWQDIWPVTGSRDVLPRAVAVEVTLKDGVKLHRLFALPS